MSADSILLKSFHVTRGYKDWKFVRLLWKCQCSCTELRNLDLRRMALTNPFLTQRGGFLSQLTFCKDMQPPPPPHLRTAEQTGEHDRPRPDAKGGDLRWHHIDAHDWLQAFFVSGNRNHLHTVWGGVNLKHDNTFEKEKFWKKWLPKAGPSDMPARTDLRIYQLDCCATWIML